MALTLTELAMLLAAAAIAAPLAKWARIGTVLGYLLAGVRSAPTASAQVFSIYEASEMLHFAEFGIVLLLFLIGLELRPKRLLSMRNAIFGLGGAQVAATALVLAAIGVGARAWPGGRPVRRPGAGAVLDRLRAAGAGGEGRADDAARPARPSPCCCSRIWPPFR